MTLIAEPVRDFRRGSLFSKEQTGQKIFIADASLIPLFCREQAGLSLLHRRRPLAEIPDYVTESSLCLPDSMTEVPVVKGEVAATLALAEELHRHISLRGCAVIYCGLQASTALFWCGFLLSHEAELHLWDKDVGAAERFSYGIYHQTGIAVPVVYRPRNHTGTLVLNNFNAELPFLRNPVVSLKPREICFQWGKTRFSPAVLEGLLLGQVWETPGFDGLENAQYQDVFSRRLRENQITTWREGKLDNLPRGKYNTYN